MLQQHRFGSIQFLVSDLIGKTNEWQQRAGDFSEPLMDQAQIRDWLAAGQQIGSHTRTHPWLTRLSPAEAREEIVAAGRRVSTRSSAVDWAAWRRQIYHRSDQAQAF